MIQVGIATSYDDRDAVMRGLVTWRREGLPYGKTTASLAHVRSVVEEAILGEDDLVLLATDEDVTVGVMLASLHYHPLMPDLRNMWEWAWWIRKEYRGQQLGKLMLDHAANWGRAVGAGGFFYSHLHKPTVKNPRKVQTDYWLDLKEK